MPEKQPFPFQYGILIKEMCRLGLSGLIFLKRPKFMTDEEFYKYLLTSQDACSECKLSGGFCTGINYASAGIETYSEKIMDQLKKCGTPCTKKWEEVSFQRFKRIL